MNKKIVLILFFLLTLLFPAANFLSAQVAAPPEPSVFVTGVNPASGEQEQILELIISGENFQNGARVSFNPSDGISVNSVNFINVVEIRINITISADAQLSSRDVIVTNPNQRQGTFREGFTVKPPSDRIPPPPTIGLTATDAHDGKIDLAWIKNDASDFSSYSLYWQETDFNNVTDLTPSAKILDQITNTYQVSELTDGIRYYFAITSVDKMGNEDKNVLTVNATPSPSTVPPVTIPFPTAPAVNEAPTSTTPREMEKITEEDLPADLIPFIILAALAALGGLIYSFRKHQLKKSQDKKTEIKKEKEFRFLNTESKLTKMEITISGGKTMDLVKKIINLKISDFSTTENGVPVDLALKIFETQKDELRKILDGPIPSEESNVLEYTITVEPVSGADIEWQIAEVSLGGLQPTSKYEIKKQGNNFVYTKNVKVAKTDEVWKKYTDDETTDSADLKKILQVHLDDLGEQEKRFKNLNQSHV